MAMFATGSREESLDLVQEAMFGFVRRYSGRPEPEWRVLFYRILQSRITDWRRRMSVRRRFLSWLGRISLILPVDAAGIRSQPSPGLTPPSPLLIVSKTA